MFGRRIARAPRTKKGHPAQRTTGAERASPTHPGGWDLRTIPTISITKSGTVKTSAKISLRPIAASSGFSTSGATGSRAIPHFGQAPGPSRTISGSIGQIHFEPGGAGGGGGGGFSP